MTVPLASIIGTNTAMAPTYSPTGPDPCGNASGANNVSLLNPKTIIYPNVALSAITTKLYAHFMGWLIPGNSHYNDLAKFGLNPGYDDSTQTQVNKHRDDMIARGINGAIMDWYGDLSASSNGVAQKLKAAAEAASGFEFAVQIDRGAVDPARNGGPGTPTQNFISRLNYAASHYFTSSKYMQRGGQPIVLEFGCENGFGPQHNIFIDWNAVRAAINVLNPRPKLIFEYYNGISPTVNGFTNPNFDGGFAWISPTASDRATGSIQHLRDFYTAALAHPNKFAMGSIYKGFNDTMASWGQGRVMPQRNGQTFLDTLNVIPTYYPGTLPTNQVPNLHIATWDDYEEGSALLMGVDGTNTATFARMTGSTLSWGFGGNVNAIDHIEIWLSTDGGLNFTDTATAHPDVTSYDLAALGLSAGTYTLLVQAVGK